MITTLVNLFNNNETIMKRFLIIIILCIASINIHSQTAKYFDAPFGGGGGFLPAWYFTNVDPLNFKLKQIGFPEISKNGLFTTGGAGFIYIGFIKNLRLGGIGFGGSTSESKTVNGENYETSYSIGGGGLTVEYTLPFIKNLGVSVGAALGRGSLEIDMYKNTEGFSWENLPNPSSTNSFTKLIDSYWLITPTLNVEVPVYRFIALRFGFGYQLSLGDSWEVNNNQNIIGVPDDLNGKSFFVQVGIFAGFFAF